MTKPPTGDYFPTTIWSLVREADHEQTVVRAAALDALLRTYAPALVNHLVRRKRLPADRADDLVQGFIADKVLEKNLVAGADAARGKFRTYLLTALDRYIVSDFRAASAQKRGGGRVASLDQMEGFAPTAPVDDHGAGRGFDIDWAQAILAQATTRMKAECEQSRRDDVWGVFHDRLLQPTLEGVEPPGYDELVARHNIASPTAASNLLITGKRMFSRLLRQTIAAYVGDDDARIDEEVNDLLAILGKAAVR